MIVRIVDASSAPSSLRYCRVEGNTAKLLRYATGCVVPIKPENKKLYPLDWPIG